MYYRRRDGEEMSGKDCVWCDNRFATCRECIDDRELIQDESKKIIRELADEILK